MEDLIVMNARVAIDHDTLPAWQLPGDRAAILMGDEDEDSELGDGPAFGEDEEAEDDDLSEDDEFLDDEDEAFGDTDDEDGEEEEEEEDDEL